MKKKLLKKTNYSIKKKIRDGIQKFEAVLGSLDGAKFGDCFPLKHTFVKGAYVREITMPKGALLTSKIHKVLHPYFIMKGDVSVMTEEGVKRIKAPYWGLTPLGTKRILYIHEDTVWVTVHVTRKKDLKKIEKDIIAKDFKELGIDVDQQNVIEEDRKKLIEFINKIPELENKREEICGSI